MGAGRRRVPSPITLRILAVNVVALAVLVAGVLYMGEYRRKLIATELDAMRTHAELFAAAIAEGGVVAVEGNPRFRQALAPATVRQMVRRLVEPTGTRARAVRRRRHPDRRQPDAVRPRRPDPGRKAAARPARRRRRPRCGTRVQGLISFWSDPSDLPVYKERVEQRAADYPETAAALQGDIDGAVRRWQNRLMLSVAAPIQHYKQVLGVVMLSRDSRHIDTALASVRLDIVKMFGVALAVTALLSFYLSGSIARPLRRLVRAAERVRGGRLRHYAIPEMNARRDEIGELARALSEMTEALWSRMDAIEAFAADVAHEIKNPLSSLHSAVETAARVKDPDQQRQLMAIIQEDVRRLDRLISDISDASRLDAELSRGEMEPVELGPMLAMVGELHGRDRADAPRIAVEMADGRAYRVNGMEGRLFQVFRNLVSNALSFSPPDGRIVITVGGEPGWAEIAVADDGPGIPPGKENAIFDRFYTERPASEDFGTHSGLGLSISRQIVEAHGGTLKAENRRRPDGAVVGARFIVRLPTA